MPVIDLDLDRNFRRILLGLVFWTVILNPVLNTYWPCRAWQLSSRASDSLGATVNDKLESEHCDNLVNLKIGAQSPGVQRLARAAAALRLRQKAAAAAAGRRPATIELSVSLSGWPQGMLTAGLP